MLVFSVYDWCCFGDRNHKSETSQLENTRLTGFKRHLYNPTSQMKATLETNTAVG